MSALSVATAGIASLGFLVHVLRTGSRQAPCPTVSHKGFRVGPTGKWPAGGPGSFQSGQTAKARIGPPCAVTLHRGDQTASHAAEFIRPGPRNYIGEFM